MTPGQIVFRNGTSSSGKSSIARELLGLLDDGVYSHLSVDAFNAMRAQRELSRQEFDAGLRRTRLGFHRSVAAMRRGGQRPGGGPRTQRAMAADRLPGRTPPEDVLLVGVHCPREELERRERARGDREAGLAALQYDLVHAHGDYDLECDTSTASPRARAERIRDFLPHRPTPTAFSRLRARYSVE
ncbi:phosphotransferase-like protein [Streptomyces griseoluteus]|uniref:phosphotransferase-like protein n=1 Tax=Streptomyces griseoluteus TaxID=29306 RepID=UPI0036B18B6C